MKKEKIILKKIEKLKSGNKKYEAIFDVNGKIVKTKFGASGMSDFTKHKDKERRERYISRHKKDLKTNNPTRAGYLSMYILWNKPSFKASVADYKKKLNTYNRTGKFPTKITGSKILKFGTDIIPFNETTMKILPPDIQTKIQKHVFEKQNLLNILKYRAFQRYNEAAKRTDKAKWPKRWVRAIINKLWTNLNPVNKFTSDWLQKAALILNKSDFNFKKRNIWWKIIENMIATMAEIENEGDPKDFLSKLEYKYYMKCGDSLLIILSKTGYNVNPDREEIAWDKELFWWTEIASKNSNFGARLFDKTSLEKLPPDIQNKLLEEYYGDKFNTQIKKLTHTENNLLKKFIDHYNKTFNIGKKPILLDSLRPALRKTGWWFLSIQPDEKESAKLI